MTATVREAGTDAAAIRYRIACAIDTALMRKGEALTTVSLEAVTDAVLALVGPKPLVWNGAPSDGYMHANSPTGIYDVAVTYGDEWGCGFDPDRGQYVSLSAWENTPEAAQSAAQAHADTAHWRNTPLGGMIGGEG